MKAVVTKKRFVEAYKDFNIYKKTTCYNKFSPMSREYIDVCERKVIEYIFVNACKDKQPSMFFHQSSSTLNGIKDIIDKYLKNEYIIYTEADYRKYVSLPNRKNKWAFGNESLKKLLKQFKAANNVVRQLLITRLSDANFHSYAGYLENGEYDKYIALADEEFPIASSMSVNICLTNVPFPKSVVTNIEKYLAEYLKGSKCKYKVDASIF